MGKWLFLALVVLTPSRCKTIALRGQPDQPGAEEFHAGGYGKTVLALALCHDDRVSDAFDDGVLWTSLGQTPNVVQELSKLYEALTGDYPTVVDERQAATKSAEKLEARSSSTEPKRPFLAPTGFPPMVDVEEPALSRASDRAGRRPDADSDDGPSESAVGRASAPW